MPIIPLFKTAIRSNFNRATQDQRYLSIPLADLPPMAKYFQRLSAEYPKFRSIINNIEESQQKLRFGASPKEWFDYYIWPRPSGIRNAYFDITNNPIMDNPPSHKKMREEFINFPVQKKNGRVDGPASLTRSAKIICASVNEAECVDRRMILSVIGKVGSGKSCFSRFLFSSRRKTFLQSDIVVSRIAFSQIIDSIPRNSIVSYLYIRILRCLIRDIIVSCVQDDNFRKKFESYDSLDPIEKKYQAELLLIANEYNNRILSGCDFRSEVQHRGGF